MAGIIFGNKSSTKNSNKETGFSAVPELKKQYFDKYVEASDFFNRQQSQPQAQVQTQRQPNNQKLFDSFKNASPDTRKQIIAHYTARANNGDKIASSILDQLNQADKTPYQAPKGQSRGLLGVAENLSDRAYTAVTGQKPSQTDITAGDFARALPGAATAVPGVVNKAGTKAVDTFAPNLKKMAYGVTLGSHLDDIDRQQKTGKLSFDQAQEQRKKYLKLAGVDINTDYSPGEAIKQGVGSALGGVLDAELLLKGAATKGFKEALKMAAGVGAPQTAVTALTEGMPTKKIPGEFAKNTALNLGLEYAGKGASKLAGKAGELISNAKVGNATKANLLNTIEELAQKPQTSVKPAIKPKEITVYRGGEASNIGDNFFTSEKPFAQKFADDFGPTGKVVSAKINPTEYLDTRVPEQRAQLETVLGKQKVDDLVSRTDTGLPYHAKKGEQESLQDAADKLGFKGIQLSEGPGVKGVTYAKARATAGEKIYDTAPNESAPLPSATPPENIQPGSKSGLAKIGPETAPGKNNIIDRVQERASKLYTQTIDRYNPIVKAGQASGKEGDIAIRNALASHYGAGSTANYHIDFGLKPIIKDVNQDNLRSFVIATRDFELAKRGIKGSDATVAEAAIKDLQKKTTPEEFAQLQKSATELYDYQKSLVKDYLVKSGVISKESAQAMFDKNNFYVPFKRVMDEVDASLGVVPGKGAASVGSQNVIKGIKGSDKQIVDPLESIVENTYKIVGLAKRNEAARALVDLAPKLNGLIEPAKKGTPAENAISVFINGKKELFSAPKDIIEAAKGLNEEQLNSIVKILAAPTRVFRETATGLNPEFFPTNIARDLQTAFITNGLHPVQWAKGFAHYMKRDDVYQEFLKSGALTSRISLDRPILKKTVGEVTRGKATLIKHPLKLLEEVGQASEVPTRLSIFDKTLKQELKKGAPREAAQQTAARAAQEGTVNFARRGSATQAANALYAFMNARVQGTDRIIRAVKENPAKASARLGMITLAPALALYAYNRNQKEYFDPRVVGDYDKQNNFILMAPWLGKDRYIKVPKGDVGKLANPLEAFLEYSDKKKSSKDITNALGEALAAWLPFQNYGDLIPTALRPPIELATNKNFFTGSEIVPDYKKNYPKQEQDTNNTSALYRAIGELTKQSPAKIENTARGYLTGFARIGEAVANPLLPEKYKSAKNDQGDAINRTPIARRFVGGAKKSPDEYALGLQKQLAAIQFDKNDLRAGANRGEITSQQYTDQILKLNTQEADLKDKANKDGYGSLLNKAINDAKEAAKAKAKETRKKKKGNKK